MDTVIHSFYPRRLNSLGNVRYIELAQYVAYIKLDGKISSVKVWERNIDSGIGFDFFIIIEKIDRFVRKIVGKHL